MHRLVKFAGDAALAVFEPSSPASSAVTQRRLLTLFS
jgi:hypothetical protein